MEKKNDGRRIGKAVCTLDGTYWNISKLSGVKENLFWLLYVLDDGEFHTQKQICDDWKFPRTTINTLTKECETAGYITLRTIPGRKRELQLCLTESGREYARQTLCLVRELEQKVLEATLNKISPTFLDDLELFARELQAVFENYEETERKLN